MTKVVYTNPMDRCKELETMRNTLYLHEDGEHYVNTLLCYANKSAVLLGIMKLQAVEIVMETCIETAYTRFVVQVVTTDYGTEERSKHYLTEGYRMTYKEAEALYRDVCDKLDEERRMMHD